MISLVLISGLTFLTAAEIEFQPRDQESISPDSQDFVSILPQLIPPERPDNPHIRDPKMCDDEQNGLGFQETAESP